MNNIYIYKILLPLSILLLVAFLGLFWVGFTPLGSNLDFDITYLYMSFVFGAIFYFIGLIDLHLTNKRNQISDVKQSKLVKVGAFIIIISLASLFIMGFAISRAIY